jgi:hypothetical protein
MSIHFDLDQHPASKPPAVPVDFAKYKDPFEAHILPQLDVPSLVSVSKTSKTLRKYACNVLRDKKGVTDNV